jgi:hypothetical protein
MARAKKKSSNTIHIPDLSGVEAKINLPEGRMLFEITDVEDGEGPAGPYYKWELTVAKGKYEGKKAKPYITSLSPDSLWNLKNLLEAAGVEIPDSATDIDKDDIIGKKVWSEIVHEEYEDSNGRKKQSSGVNGTFESADDDDGDEKPSKGKKKDDEDDDKPSKGKGKKKDEEVKYDRDAIDEMDEDELGGLNDEHDLSVDLDDFTSIKKKRNAIWDALEKNDLTNDE